MTYRLRRGNFVCSRSYPRAVVSATLARRLAPCCATARFRRMRAERATAPTAVGRPRALSCAPCCGVGQGMPHDGQPTRCIGSGDDGRCEEAARALHWPLDGAPPHALSFWPTGGACQEARRSAGHTHRASSGAVAPRSSLRLAPTGCGRAPAARFRRRPAASALSGPRAARNVALYAGALWRLRPR